MNLEQLKQQYNLESIVQQFNVSLPIEDYRQMRPADINFDIRNRATKTVGRYDNQELGFLATFNPLLGYLGIDPLDYANVFDAIRDNLWGYLVQSAQQYVISNDIDLNKE